MDNLEAQIASLRKDKRNVALPYLFLIGSCLLFLLSSPLWLSGWNWIWIIPCMGIVQYYIVISGHEAVHSTLCYPKQLNDFFGVVGQAMVGVNFTAYRQQHLDHHRCRSYNDDPDGHIYTSVMFTPAGWKRWLTLIFGMFLEILIKIRQKGSGGYGTERNISPKNTRKMRRDSLLVIMAQLSLLTICHNTVGDVPIMAPETSFGQWSHFLVSIIWGYAVLWIVPLFCITVFLNRCRIVIEHGLALSISHSMEKEFGGPRIPTIDICPHPFERRLFAPFLFNYHCSHHLFMAVPHYNLPKLHKLLQNAQFSGHHHVSKGYIQAILRAMQQPPPKNND